MMKDAVAKPKKNRIHWRRWWPFYLMGLPGIAYLAINNYLPMAGLQVAFKKYDYSLGIWDSAWNGVKNFKYLFKTKDAFIMVRNTICYNLVWIILGIIVGVLAAILISEVMNKAAKKFYQTVILLPYLMSMVVISYLAYAYLSPEAGLFTKLIERLSGRTVQFYAEKKWWPFILTFINQWRGIGFGMILYLSTLLGIDKSLYEAADLDGASRWQQHRFVTLPLLKPTMILMFILGVGQIFRSDFGLFYQVPMNQGALFSVTQTIDTYVYRALLRSNDVGMSSAASFLQSVVGFIFVFAANCVVTKIDRGNALF